jgi:hypothetical protein
VFAGESLLVPPLAIAAAAAFAGRKVNCPGWDFSAKPLPLGHRSDAKAGSGKVFYGFPVRACDKTRG